MATYTYKCNKCDGMFEAKHSIHAAPLKDCTICSASNAVERVVSSGQSFRIGGLGVTKPTSMFNVSADRGY